MWPRTKNGNLHPVTQPALATSFDVGSSTYMNRRLKFLCFPRSKWPGLEIIRPGCQPFRELEGDYAGSLSHWITSPSSSRVAYDLAVNSGVPRGGESSDSLLICMRDVNSDRNALPKVVCLCLSSPTILLIGLQVSSNNAPLKNVQGLTPFYTLQL